MGVMALTRDLLASSNLPNSLSAATPSNRLLRNFFYALYFALLPTYVRNNIQPPTEPTRPPSKTAYLDGFRGLASIGVVVLHMALGFFPGSNYGFNGRDDRDHVLQMPFFRLLYSGQPTLFFIVSGYALSLGTLKKVRSQAYGALQVDLGSKIFRRGLRLYLPGIAATFIAMVMNQYGLFPSVAVFEGKDVPHQTMDFPARQDYFITQFFIWCKTIPPLFYPFNWDNFSQNSPYAYQLWTIPVEFRCSMILFLVHVAFARSPTAIRLWLTSTLALLLLTFERWDVFLFLAGAILAEMDLIKDEWAKSPALDLSTEKPAGRQLLTSRVPSWIKVLVMITGLWILSVPAADIWDAWTFKILEYLGPPTYTGIFRFWDAVGTVFLLWAMTELESVQRFFSQPLLLYFGKLSFSLYLTHTTMLKFVLYPLVPWVWLVTGWESDVQYFLGFIVAGGITLLAAFWFADVFHRLVEQPLADLANWIDVKCARPAPAS